MGCIHQLCLYTVTVVYEMSCVSYDLLLPKKYMPSVGAELSALPENISNYIYTQCSDLIVDTTNYSPLLPNSNNTSTATIYYFIIYVIVLATSDNVLWCFNIFVNVYYYCCHDNKILNNLGVV